MEIVTNAELKEYFALLIGTLEGIGAKLLAIGDGHQAYFNRREAAEYLRVSTAQIDRYAATGLLKKAKIGEQNKSVVLFRRADLDSFVAAHLELDREEARAAARRQRRS